MLNLGQYWIEKIGDIFLAYVEILKTSYCVVDLDSLIISQLFLLLNIHTLYVESIFTHVAFERP